MRATWIVRLLNAGTKANVMTTVAGVADPEALARYVQFMDPVPTGEAHAAIRALSRPRAPQSCVPRPFITYPPDLCRSRPLRFSHPSRSLTEARSG